MEETLTVKQETLFLKVSMIVIIFRKYMDVCLL